MPGEVSEGEFSRTMQALRDDIARGFNGINARLDVLNGKTARHGESIAVLQRDTKALTACDEAHDVAIGDISQAFTRLETLVKQSTRQALRETVPSKKLAVSAMAGGAAVIELVWRFATWKLGI